MYTATDTWAAVGSQPRGMKEAPGSAANKSHLKLKVNDWVIQASSVNNWISLKHLIVSYYSVLNTGAPIFCRGPLSEFKYPTKAFLYKAGTKMSQPSCWRPNENTSGWPCWCVLSELSGLKDVTENTERQLGSGLSESPLFSEPNEGVSWQKLVTRRLSVLSMET